MIDFFDILSVILAVVFLFFGIYGGIASIAYSVLVIVVKQSAYKENKPSGRTVYHFLALVKLFGLFNR